MGAFIVVPMGISLYWAFTRPSDKRSEKQFDQTWYKWKKQYMWHELWFRSHVILVMALVVIFIYEANEWPVAIPVVSILTLLRVLCCLKYTSRVIENRVPSLDEKRRLYNDVTDTMRSQSEASTNFFKELTAQSTLDTHDTTQGIELQQPQA